MSKIDFNALRDRAYKCACAHVRMGFMTRS